MRTTRIGDGTQDRGAVEPADARPFPAPPRFGAGGSSGASYQNGLRHVIAALVALCALTAGARAAEVDFSLSTHRPVAGITFNVQVTITNADEYTMPAMPDVDWAERVSGPRRRSFERLSTVNGRMSQTRTITLTYEYLAPQPGEYTFPPIALTADGTMFRSPPMRVVVTEAEGGQLVQAEVVPQRSTIYLGEPLELTLRVRIRRFVDRELGVVLSPDDTWRMIDLDRSSWGPFLESLSETIGRRRQPLPAEEVTIDDAVYYQYELEATQWPKQTGRVEPADVHLLVQYVTKLRTGRSFFGDERLEIAAQQTVVEAAETPAIEVTAPPAQGRPDVFSGAVGRFSLVVDASPTDVAVGDPITLTLIISDETDGKVDLEMLQPPPLTKVRALTDDFRVPNEPLAGVVQGRSKVFRQTIRARRAEVESVPSIPFAYLDPQREQYVTLRSDPIPVSVQPAARIEASDVETAGPQRSSETTELTELEGGILANRTGTAALLADQRLTLQWWHLLVFALPPAAFAVVAFGTVRQRRLRSEAGLIRARRAGRNARRRIVEAKHMNGPQQADAVAAALSGYVEDRCQAPAGAMTRSDVVDRLRRSAVSDDVVRDVEHVLQTCEALKYGAAGASANGITEQAGRCIEQLERSRLR